MFVKWEDLREDEKRFLIAWHNASDEARKVALELMVNHQQHDTSSAGSGGKVVNIDDLRKPKN